MHPRRPPLIHPKEQRLLHQKNPPPPSQRRMRPKQLMRIDQRTLHGRITNATRLWMHISPRRFATSSKGPRAEHRLGDPLNTAHVSRPREAGFAELMDFSISSVRFSPNKRQNRKAKSQQTRFKFLLPKTSTTITSEYEKSANIPYRLSLPNVECRREFRERSAF